MMVVPGLGVDNRHFHAVTAWHLHGGRGTITLTVAQFHTTQPGSSPASGAKFSSSVLVTLLGSPQGSWGVFGEQVGLNAVHIVS